jgi:hypothetical protein
MGVRLDWDIESDQSGKKNAREDPEVVRTRRRTQFRFLLLILFVVSLITGALALLQWQLNRVDQQLEDRLRDAIEAEVAALRIGDWNAFSALQRSASPDWQMQQRAYFDAYQTIKVTNDVNLAGTVRAIEVDSQRARVVVEEVINGVPYSQVWFYWRYEDGWRHVPPDYTFWGELSQYQGRLVTVNYRAVDEKLALDIGVSIEGWIDSTCGAILECGDLPHINLSIQPQDGATKPEWDAANIWQLNVPSPYVVRARSDRPFSGTLLMDTASVIAARLVSEATLNFSTPTYPRDAYYLYPAIANWLTGLFAQVNTNSHLIMSLAENYGRLQVGALAQQMQADSQADVLRAVTGADSLDSANLDWRDFLTWRLQAENELRARGDLDAYLTLYTPEAVEIARQRFGSAPAQAGVGVVILAEKGQAIDGVPQISATVRYGEDDSAPTERVLFRLSGETWKRAN